MIRSLLLTVVALATLCPTAAALDRWTMLVDINGHEVEGMPLSWSRQRVFLLARDGRLWDFPPNKAEHFRKTSSYFSSYSAAEIQGELIRELGGKLEVTGTGHYLVAHPKGKEAWSGRFEDLYRSVYHYFTQRGLRIHEPEFPLIAVVWGNRNDFLHYAAAQGTQVSPNVLGFYSPISNRVTLYDLGAGNDRMWKQNEATIIHEATHQVAFNVGVHNRFGVTPKWLAEGLGTMFEARGVWDWISYPDQRDRINRMRFQQFRQWQTHGRKEGNFVSLITSDRQFQANPAAAYAEAWAWVFFLTETYPQKFAAYVQRVATRPNFEDYPSTRRMSDFTAAFGDDLRMLEKHFLNFIGSLQ